MTTIHFFDFSTKSDKTDFSIPVDAEFTQPLVLLRLLARVETIEWTFDFGQATEDEIYFWSEASLIVQAEKAFRQDKFVILEGYIVEHDDFFRCLTIFRGVFGSLPDVIDEDSVSISFGSPIRDPLKDNQFFTKVSGAPV